MQEKFVVPQFIENEARVFGPVTVRQFLIVIMGGLLAFICFKLSDFTLFILQAILIILFFGTLAFVKINTMPFHFFLLNFIASFKKPKVRIWIKEEIKILGESLPRKEKFYEMMQTIHNLTGIPRA